MKRKLNKEEKKLTQKGLKQMKSDLKETKIELAYLEDFNNFNTKWEDYLAKKEKKNKDQKSKMVGQATKSLIQQIDLMEKSIVEMQDQLKDGVTVKDNKTPIGVN